MLGLGRGESCIEEAQSQATASMSGMAVLGLGKIPTPTCDLASREEKKKDDEEKEGGPNRVIPDLLSTH